MSPLILCESRQLLEELSLNPAEAVQAQATTLRGRRKRFGNLAIGIGRAEVGEADRLNIYWAAMEACRRAVESLPARPVHILVDGKHRIAGCRVAQTPLVDSDALSASIAAASILAKVTRASLMEDSWLSEANENQKTN